MDRPIAGAEDIVVGDLSSIAETKSVAEQVNKLGGFDAVIHNVAPVRCFDTALQSRDHNPSCLGWPAKTMPWQTGHAPGPRMNEVEQTGEAARTAALPPLERYDLNVRPRRKGRHRKAN